MCNKYEGTFSDCWKWCHGHGSFQIVFEKIINIIAYGESRTSHFFDLIFDYDERKLPNSDNCEGTVVFIQKSKMFLLY